MELRAGDIVKLKKRFPIDGKGLLLPNIFYAEKRSELSFDKTYEIAKVIVEDKKMSVMFEKSIILKGVIGQPACGYIIDRFELANESLNVGDKVKFCNDFTGEGTKLVSNEKFVMSNGLRFDKIYTIIEIDKNMVRLSGVDKRLNMIRVQKVKRKVK